MSKRETTRLLMTHLLEPLARECESYIIDRRTPDHMFKAGHWELARAIGKATKKGLSGACEGNSADMIDLALESCDPQFGMLAACRLGDIPLIKKLMAHGAIIDNAWQSVHFAAIAGDLKLCCFFIEQLPDGYLNEYVCDALIACGRGPDSPIVKLGYALGSNDPAYVENRALREACRLGIQTTIDFHLARGGDPLYGLEGACLSANTEIASQMINLLKPSIFNPDDDSYWCVSDHIGTAGSCKFLDWMIEHYPVFVTTAHMRWMLYRAMERDYFNEYVRISCNPSMCIELDYADIVEHLIDLGVAEHPDIDANYRKDCYEMITRLRAARITAHDASDMSDPM